MKHYPRFSNFIKCKPIGIPDVQVRVISIKKNVNIRRAVINDMICIEISPRSFGEDPSIFIFYCSWCFCFALDEQVVIVEHNSFDFAVFHQGVFVDQSGFWYFMPIDLIDCMLVGQSYDYFILIIVAVYSKFLKPPISVPSCNGYSLW